MAIRLDGKDINLNTIKKVRVDGHTVYQEKANFCIEQITDGTLTVKYYTTTTTTAGLKYKINDGEWTDITASPTDISLTAGDKCYFKAESFVCRASKWTNTGDFNLSGDIQSLNNYSTSTPDYAYTSMFSTCTTLKSILDLKLSATNLSKWCYLSMFGYCSNLTSIPADLLPATTLADEATECYERMFYQCTSLTSIPANLLPATILTTKCYGGMFCGCAGLTSIPENLLPATALAGECYEGMFESCTGLTSIPADLLPATTLAYGCYWCMFQGCTGLTTLPKLNATTLYEYCYSQMFSSCSNIKVSTAQEGEYQTPYQIPYTGTGTTATNALSSMFSSTGGTFKGTPTINTTYYTSNTVV